MAADRLSSWFGEADSRTASSDLGIAASDAAAGIPGTAADSGAADAGPSPAPSPVAVPVLSANLSLSLRSLPGHHAAAVMLGWAGWVGDPLRLAEVWPSAPTSADRPAGVHPVDWMLLRSAAATQAERRARWVWHDIASETLRLVPACPARDTAATAATDALSVLDDSDACAAAAAACSIAVAAAGKPVARLVVAMAYRGCRPHPELIEDALAGVARTEWNGRIYVC